MKKILIFIIIISLAWIVGYLIFNRKKEIRNVPPKNGTIIIFGDSLAEGVGATAGNDLASWLQKKLGKTVINQGRAGDTTRDALGHLGEASRENPGTVIVILGGNDVLKKIPKDETFRNLEKIVTFFQDQGAAVVLVGVRSGLIGDGRGEDFETVAEKTSALYLSDILQDVFADQRFMSDPIHPNDAGYALIGERLSPVIADLYRD